MRAEVLGCWASAGAVAMSASATSATRRSLLVILRYSRRIWRRSTDDADASEYLSMTMLVSPRRFSARATIRTAAGRYLDDRFGRLQSSRAARGRRPGR